jgi:hypothetical protein
MFILYPFLFATLYNCVRRLASSLKYPGPTNPCDDMPARIMPHVMSCISYEENADCPPTPPIEEIVIKEPPRNAWKQSAKSMAKELPFRRNITRNGDDGKDVRLFPLEPDMEILADNIEKFRVIKKLEYSMSVSGFHGPSMIPPAVKAMIKSAMDEDPYRINLFSGGLMKEWDEPDFGV